MAVTIGYTDQNTGKTIYALLINSAGSYWKPATSTFVAYTGTLSDHVISLTEGTLLYYAVSISTNIATDSYRVRIYEQIGGSPAIPSDWLRTERQFYYSQAVAKEITTKEFWDLQNQIKSDVDNITTTGGGVDTADSELIKQIHSRVYQTPQQPRK